jgi:hypothetical protein
MNRRAQDFLLLFFPLAIYLYIIFANIRDYTGACIKKQKTEPHTAASEEFTVRCLSTKKITKINFHQKDREFRTKRTVHMVGKKKPRYFPGNFGTNMRKGFFAFRINKNQRYTT